MKDGFKAGCRPIIGLDGCHLKGYYQGHLLAVVGIDADDSIYPIAFAVVERKTLKDQLWKAARATYESEFQSAMVELKARKICPPIIFCIPTSHGENSPRPTPTSHGGNSPRPTLLPTQPSQVHTTRWMSIPTTTSHVGTSPTTAHGDTSPRPTPLSTQPSQGHTARWMPTPTTTHAGTPPTSAHGGTSPRPTPLPTQHSQGHTVRWMSTPTTTTHAGTPPNNCPWRHLSKASPTANSTFTRPHC
ncbi:hypothetical protein V6N13_099153 [Hibiscus sabdariffa]